MLVLVVYGAALGVSSDIRANVLPFTDQRCRSFDMLRGLEFAQDKSAAQEFATELTLIRHAFAFRTDAGQFRCDQWVDVLNHLKNLGKDKCLSALNAYFAKYGDHERI